MIEMRTATRACFLAYLRGVGVTSLRPEVRALALQVELGRSWAFWSPNDPPCGLMGIFDDGQTSELWFVPGNDAAKNIMQIVRMTRRRVQFEASVWPGRSIIARVNKYNTPGKRMAQMCGFSNTGFGSGNVERWNYDGRSYKKG